MSKGMESITEEGDSRKMTPVISTKKASYPRDFLEKQKVVENVKIRLGQYECVYTIRYIVLM